MILGLGTFIASCPEGVIKPTCLWHESVACQRVLVLVFLWGVAACGTPAAGEVASIDADAARAMEPSADVGLERDVDQALDASLDVDSEADTGTALPGAWPKMFGGTASDRAHAMALGLDGRIVLAGEMRGQFDFAEEALEAPLADARTALLMSFESDGTPLWGRLLGGVGHTHAHGVAVSSKGVVATCGSKQSPLAHGDSVQPEGSHGVFAAAWLPDGTASWLHTFEGASLDLCNAIVIEQATGSPFVEHTLMAFTTGQQLHLARFDANGELVYRVGHGHGLNNLSTDVSVVQAMASDGKGAVWVAGMFSGFKARNVGGDDFTAPGESAIFLAKYDVETGVHLWSGAWGSPAFYHVVGFDRARDLQVVGERVIIAVSSLPQIDFGAGPLGPAPDGNSNSGFLAAFDLSGAHLWSRELTDENGVASFVNALDVTQKGDLAVLGYDKLLRINPVDGSVSGGAAIDSGGTDFLIDSSGMAIISYSLKETGSFGGVGLTSAGSADIVLNRVPMP
jgi:hypothetical protein